MRAAENALESKTIKETTTREIAAAAGTNEAMISYYFGGKEGLMIALFHEMNKGNPNTRPEKIAESCIAERSIYPLVEQLARFYNARPNLIRMTISEIIAGSSKIKSLYNTKYADGTPNFIEVVLNSMIKSGIYSDTFNVKFATMSIMSMIVAPNILLPATQALHMSDKLDSAEWINHIARSIDLLARSPAH
jgi:AcrR family transcriptional regulator